MNADFAEKLDCAMRLIMEVRGCFVTGQQESSPMLSAKKVNPADKGWFTIKDAMDWTGLGRDHLRNLMREGKLWYRKVGGRGDVRIPKAHLDEQMVLGFPALDVTMTLAELERQASRPVTRLIPGPKRDDDCKPSKGLVLRNTKTKK